MTSVSTAKNQEPPFNAWLLLRLGTFHIGSAMGDILVTSVWNRILITNFGIPATPVGLLIALRYLISPLSLWAGFRSDTKPILGLKRTVYIWAGRGLMILALPLLGFSVVFLEENSSAAPGWLLALASSILYGIGTLISGSPYLALVRDSAPKERQGLAIGVVETMLIIFFALSGITFGRWMEIYDQTIFWQMIIATIVIGGFFWLFATIGVERRYILPYRGAKRAVASGFDAFVATFKHIAADPRTRRFFLFLVIATLAAWIQDAILEPFGAEALQADIGTTTRFNSYWQGATAITLVASAIILRKRPPEQLTTVTKGGLIVMGLGMSLLTGASFSGQLGLAQLALVVFGAGFGVYTFGGLSLMAVMATDREAGAYLGLWTIAVLVSKGLGTSLGGIMRDVLLLITGEPAISYGLIFLVEAAGLLLAAAVLSRRDILGFARDYGRIGAETIPAGAMD